MRPRTSLVRSCPRVVTVGYMAASPLCPLSAASPAVDDPRRLVEFEAVHNFRDLGGYEVGDGRQIAWGRLFRADGLYRLGDADLDVVDALGIRTVIDLRSAGEVDDHGTFPVEKMPLSFHHLPIIDATWMTEEVPTFTDDDQGAIDFLTWAYSDMLDKGAERFATAISLIASPEAVPVVFHCAAGKDRTGILAALVLGGLGVDDATIVADYQLTAAAMERMRRWVEANHPDMLSRMHDAPSYMRAARPEAIESLLAEIRADHGTVRSFLTEIGVDDAAFDRLAESVTTDTNGA